ncbi:MAG: hypothetical protein ACRCTZ_01025 [Sarcina sp.]
MSYPMRDTNLFSVSDAIDNIASSEASILQGLNDLFCSEFVTKLLDPTVLDPTSPSYITPTDRLTIISNILNSMATKECTVASILNAAANIIVVEKGLIAPSSPSSASSDDFSCNSCK